MIRLFSVMLVAVMTLVACQPAAPTIGADGQPIPRAYRIGQRETG